MAGGRQYFRLRRLNPLGEGLDTGKKKQDGFSFEERPPMWVPTLIALDHAWNPGMALKRKIHASETSTMLVGQLSFSRKSGEPIFMDGCPDLSHKPKVVGDIVQRRQPEKKQLA